MKYYVIIIRVSHLMFHPGEIWLKALFSARRFSAEVDFKNTNQFAMGGVLITYSYQVASLSLVCDVHYQRL